MLYRRFEKLIDVFRDAPTAAPPDRVLPFYTYYLKQVWPSFAALLIVGLFGALIEVALFSYLSRIIDLAQGTPNVDFFKEHGLELTWMVVVALVLRPVFVGLHDLLVHQTLSPSMTSLIRWQNHSYVLKQSLNFFQNDFAGRIAQRIMQTGNSLRDSAVQAVDALWHVLIYAISSLVLFAEADWRLMIPLLTWIVAFISALYYFVPRVKERSVVSSDARSKLMGRIVDGYTNITTLKLFAHTNFEQQYAREAIKEQTEKAQLAGRVVTSMDVVITSMNGLLIVCTTGLALWLWTQSLITRGRHRPGHRAGDPHRQHVRLDHVGGHRHLRKHRHGPGRLAKHFAAGQRHRPRPGQTAGGGPWRSAFRHVDFHYGKQSGIIGGLNLTIKPGEKIGLIGPSGAGKSTLVNLLLRLYDVEGGRILIDGQNIADVSQESLRERIGMITQDTSLLHRSIRDNLLYGKPDATDAELWEAVHKARADGFIPPLSDAEGRSGFDAHVGERGVKLSGGQRQRIAIARVLLKDAPILIMDEATSALDSEVEAAIQESLETLMQGKTVIAIAHRLSTIARMDRLVVLENGRIAETGSSRRTAGPWRFVCAVVAAPDGWVCRDRLILRHSL